ncbi:MAG TPA: HEAT repeat domain-containing protein [Acidobacteriota bacterium]|nr:HEAT repeat domain-containing protein [Acidobacteriota bacterium]
MKSKIREMMVLSLYGELGDAEEFLLQEHLRSNPSLRSEMEELKRLHDLMAEDEWGEPSDELLYQARSRLFRALEEREAQDAAERALPAGLSAAGPRAEEARLGAIVRFYRWLFGPEAGMGWAAACGAAAMLLLGLGMGYFLFQTPAAGPFLDVPEEESIANVRFLESGDDKIDVIFQEVRPRRVSGSLQDARIRRLLAHAAVNDDNDGVRLRAVDEFYSYSGESTDDIVRRTLIISLQTDSNAGVRQRALAALQKMPFDAEIKQAYLNVLRYDPNPGMRVAVINALESARSDEPFQVDEEILDSLREGAADQNDYVRLRSQEFLQKVSEK